MELYKRSGLARVVSERSAPLSAAGFSRMIERAAAAAKLGIKTHAHMLRHACGFRLANDGVDTRSLQAYLGHRNIHNTTVTRRWRRIGSWDFGGTNVCLRTAGPNSNG
jgi:site-specific recombinase XerD